MVNVKYKKEIGNGYFYSLLSPLLLSAFFALLIAIYIVFSTHSLSEGLRESVSMFLFYAFFSFLLTGVFSAIIGIPFYYLLKYYNVVNAFTMTAVGIAIGFLTPLLFALGLGIGFLGAVYGGFAAYMFWFGSEKQL